MGPLFVDFQVALSSYKLVFQNKNYIKKINTQFFFFFGLQNRSIGPLRLMTFLVILVVLNA